jgi:small subunit ribosomal protein S13
VDVCRTYVKIQNVVNDKDNPMARIFGMVLPDAKRIDYSLTLLKGIGRTNAKKVLAQAKVEGSVRIKDITEEQLKKISVAIESNIKVEGDLREEVTENIKRLKEIGVFTPSSLICAFKTSSSGENIQITK